MFAADWRSDTAAWFTVVRQRRLVCFRIGDIGADTVPSSADQRGAPAFSAASVPGDLYCCPAMSYATRLWLVPPGIIYANVFGVVITSSRLAPRTVYRRAIDIDGLLLAPPLPAKS